MATWARRPRLDPELEARLEAGIEEAERFFMAKPRFSVPSTRQRVCWMRTASPMLSLARWPSTPMATNGPPWISTSC